MQLVTGFLNVLNWYPWSWSFVPVHRFLAYVLIGSILLHIAVKLPDIRYGLSVRLRDGDVLTEMPWSENPDSYSNNEHAPPKPPVPTGISRRGVLTAAAAGIGIVAVTSVGQTFTPLESIGLLAPRQFKKGPAHVPVNRTADQAMVRGLALDPNWQLVVHGPNPYVLTLADIEAMAVERSKLPDLVRRRLERRSALARVAATRRRPQGRW